MSFFTWNPDPSQLPSKPIPLTILSGFLGAGKTTVLNWVLAEASTRKMAVLVNDLGEVNVDAMLIKSAVKELDGAVSGILELKGGCICCTIQTDLLDALLEIVERFQPEHILVEATGVAEPKAILQTLYTPNSHGRRGTDFVYPANMVTVLDGGNFEQYFESPENTGDTRRTHLLPSDPRLPLQELLMEQIECADVLLINKVDVMEEAERARFRTYLKGLNVSAEVWECRDGEIDVVQLMEQHRYNKETTLAGAAWLHTNEIEDHGHHHGHDHHHHEHGDHDDDHHHDHDHKDYGLETFLFRAEAPFVESRFFKVMRSGLAGVLRAKGVYWTEQEPDRIGSLSIAGKMMRAGYLSKWNVVMSGPSKSPPDGVWGRPRQEFVFIGIDLDREAIKKALISCLLEEMPVMRSPI
ncbi:MAG: GTP-binding protein [Opitutales bacterium]|nr:GTP-binding protein [Opitutales bacterium]